MVSSMRRQILSFPQLLPYAVSGGVKMHEKWRLEDAGRGDGAKPPAPRRIHQMAAAQCCLRLIRDRSDLSFDSFFPRREWSRHGGGVGRG